MADISILQAYISGLAAKAIRAVAQYEHWHAEVERLTAEIRNCECPLERVIPADDECPKDTLVFGGSHFQQAKERLDRPVGPDGQGVPTLATIAAEPDVKACPSCSRLCELIAERKAAKVRRGVAKRAVRHVGKLVLAEEVEHG